MKIYLDVYLAKNLGDDLFVDVIANEFPNVEFYLNYYGKHYDEFLKKYKNVHRPLYPTYWKILNKMGLYDYINDGLRLSKEYDAYIFMGGSIFREEEQYWKELYNQRLNVLNCFKKLNKPVLVLGSNFGPVHTKQFKELYSTFFNKCDCVSFRDMYSYKLFSYIPSVHYGHDIIFQKKFKQYEKENTISYSIVDPNHKENLSQYEEYYIDTIIKSVVQNVKKGIRCNLLSFCEIEGDLNVCKKVYNQIPVDCRNMISIHNYNGNIDEFLEIISKSKLIIASRFHANILGILSNTPIIPIVYSEKTTNVLNDLNYLGRIFKINDFDDVLNEEYIEQICNSNQYSLINFNKIFSSSKKQFDYLRRIIFMQDIHL